MKNKKILSVYTTSDIMDTDNILRMQRKNNRQERWEMEKKTVDARGLACPLPVVNSKKAAAEFR